MDCSTHSNLATNSTVIDFELSYSENLFMWDFIQKYYVNFSYIFNHIIVKYTKKIKMISLVSYYDLKD